MALMTTKSAEHAGLAGNSARKVSADGIYLKSRELESCKAKTGEEAECTFVHEHSKPVFTQ